MLHLHGEGLQVLSLCAWFSWPLIGVLWLRIPGQVEPGWELIPTPAVLS